MNQSIKEAIRIADSKNPECKYTAKKFSTRVDFINAHAREAFRTNTLSMSTLKCANAFNYYRVRSEVINKKLVSSKCPRCNNPKT